MTAKLTDLKVKNAVPRTAKYTIAAGHGLTLLVMPDGAKYWRLRYRNDKGYEKDWIERQLAHGDPDKIRGTYNKAQYLEPRRKMMQAWADYLDSLQEGGKVVIGNFGRAA